MQTRLPGPVDEFGETGSKNKNPLEWEQICLWPLTGPLEMLETRGSCAELRLNKRDACFLSRGPEDISIGGRIQGKHISIRQYEVPRTPEGYTSM